MAEGNIAIGSPGNKAALAAAISLLLIAPLARAESPPGIVKTLTDGPAFDVHYTATFSADALVFGELMGYDTVRLEDGDCLDEPGQPALPSKGIRIALPAGMAVTGVRVVDTQSRELAGEYTIFPVQPPRHVSEADSDIGFVAPDPETYASATAYPGKLVEFTEQTDLAGQGIALVRLYPIQYVPAEGRLTLYTSITFVLEGKDGYVCGDYLPASISARNRDEYERMVMDMVVNPADVELRLPENPPPGTRGVPPGDYDYVIITKANWIDDFQPLADWKTRKGTPATLVDRDWIYDEYGGSGNQARIRAFVQDAHNNWGTTYFLLGGDTDTIPRHTRTISGDGIPNDTYYADYDGDWTCEVHVGRASVRNATAISTFIGKVLTYEQDPPLSDYGKTAAFVGFDLYTYGSHEGEDCKKDIRNMYLPSGWTYRREYDSESGGHKSDVIAYLNQGNNLVNHIDHCGADALGVGITNHDQYLSTSDIDNLYNGDRQSIFYTIGCWACAYEYSNCIAEHFVRDTNGGGVAFIGNSRYGWYSTYEDDYFSLRYDRYFFRSLLNQNHYHLGSCFSDHKNDAYQGNSTYRYIFTELTLLGDPELPIWTADPETLLALHDSSLPVGPQTFEVHVVDGSGDVSGATVCLWKGDEVYLIGTTNPFGQVVFTPEPATAGTMYVTVTKRNYKPYLGSATVEQGYALTVNVEGYGVVFKDPDQEIYGYGQTVELSAYGGTGWVFDHWSGHLEGSENPTTIYMDGDKTVTAHFVEESPDDCPEDLNGDGHIGLEDLAILLANYGQTGMGPEDGDFDGDGDVDLADLSQLLAVYGQDCPTR